MTDQDEQQPTILYTLEVTRDSSDLGMDKGTTCHVVDADLRRGLVLWVPELDMTVSGVRADHPDLRLVPEQLKLPLEQHEDCDCSRCLPPTF
jgi:hypothetical protein